MNTFDLPERNPIFDAVAEGMAPFRLKRIDIYADYDIDFHKERIEASAVLMSGYTISFREIADAWELSTYPDQEMRRVAEAFKKKFRHERLHYPSPANVTLGEN